MTYLAVFEDKSSGVRQADLIAALERDWPAVVIHERQGQQESRGVVWTYSEGGQELEGYSHVDGTCIYLDSPLEVAARFAIWFRGLVPADVEMFFCDEGYSFAGKLEHDMNSGDAMAIFLGE
ncbi:hypothetical protein [Streptomyces roseus]|uniref:hypothetical protein n=1 Tax=Streptomyces roseus TaxID=66430 RepID=UPI00131A6325|nr:hypothetical protein [Streptomyces roseus]